MTGFLEITDILNNILCIIVELRDPIGFVDHSGETGM